MESFAQTWSEHCKHTIFADPIDEIKEGLFKKYINGIRFPEELEHSDTAWFGNMIICDNQEIKEKLVGYLEKNKIQTRSLFSGNLLAHPGYAYLDDYRKYPVSNSVLQKVFFTGNPPHYGPKILNYIEDVLKRYE